MRRKVYILESFSFKGAQIPNHELRETMGFNDQHVPISLGKRLLAWRPGLSDPIISRKQSQTLKIITGQENQRRVETWLPCEWPLIPPPWHPHPGSRVLPVPKALTPTAWIDYYATPMLISRERFPRGLEAHSRITSPGNRKEAAKGENLRSIISRSFRYSQISNQELPTSPSHEVSVSPRIPLTTWDSYWCPPNNIYSPSRYF